MKRKIVFILSMLCTGLLPLTVQAESVYEVSNDKGFATQEECLQYFTGCLAKSDLEGAVEAFAVDHCVDNFDFTANLERFNVWSYEQSIPLSPENELARQFDKAIMREEITDDIRTFCLSMSVEDINWRESQKITDTEVFLDSIELEDFSSLDVERMVYAGGEFDDNEKHQANMQKLYEIYGCGSIEDYFVVYTLEDERYVGTVQFIEFDGQWYLYVLHSQLAGMSTPDVMKITDEDYARMLEELEEMGGTE